MALSRRSGRKPEVNIWPGFVDAMTALTLVLMFVLSMFMIVQFFLRETITGQESRLDQLGSEVAQLSQALGLARSRSESLQGQVTSLSADLADTRTLAGQQALMIDSLTSERDSQAARIASFEEQVAGLLSEKSDLSAALAAAQDETAQRQAALEEAQGTITTLQAENAREIDQKEAVQLALANLRKEVDAQAEAARLDASRREALQALVESLRADAQKSAARIAELDDKLTAEQQARVAEAAQAKALLDQFSDRKAEEISGLEAKLTDQEKLAAAEAAAAQALREKLANSQTELTSMTLALEEQRKKAEETLALLAAADAARTQLETARADDRSEIDRSKAAAAKANELLARQRASASEDQKRIALLNQQTLELRRQLSSLQATLDASAQRDSDRQVQVETLGTQLNSALAQVAEEQRKRAELEERERKRLEAEATDLRRARSEFFARTRAILEDRPGVEIVGDRFVFSSEILFPPGSADLSDAGKTQIARVAEVIRDVSRQIPDGIDWILRVDGHTDDTPLRGGRYADNWELSQARALSVVRFLIDDEGIPANRLSANGFGEFQPIDTGDSPEARARNRRIELKFTER
ncbi:peptidoglycan -binding protein [Paroceanicella profunda]|uniref:Peptidoglycan-binding protein n=1 Tax=Paroceanicella profunda TaxID=2579971 RepID=A0A5B8FQG5_9RHOB|nr:peptidoglycan -binding protein [Paroceanicella profunda]QDL90886.1 peptidoglycan -binding protein [Paroceanicella profunda]